MIDKKTAYDVLEKVVSGGADFAEIFAQTARTNNIVLVDGKIEKISDNVLCGVGIRAFLGTETVYASTCDVSYDGLLRCAASVAEVISATRKHGSITLRERIFPNIHPVIIEPVGAETKYKIDLLRSGCDAAKGYDPLIAQVQGTLASVDRSIWIANTEGLFTSDRHIRTRMAISSVASEGNENQSGACSPGRGMGLEMFETVMTPSEIGLEASRQAMVNLRAGYCPAGQMTVAIENGFGGVIFHEACGHSLEATSVGIGTSQMCGKLGQQIANEKITAIDDGSIPGAWGSVNIDDEGNPTRRNVLIENGILKNYMIDRLGSRRMGMAMTGSGRRENYT